ncbi:hypothetical protein [Simiduia agarivorans]|uniref:Nucleotide-diphospho-sugar transferase domain-containing protein n=1 Tax=Simiduia agarivorans (strain DSM 21679 / JCM 13881 / BCRC 17597 / SA1) TaxID=1117647 RepID=K4KKW9_SIMAS|nr:hypothetical protein [Simiduia agarivorans]AFU99799.1 hypothetical protein M5M_13275 [Simiduia agarivorans SA1 = DSM 21679]
MRGLVLSFVAGGYHWRYARELESQRVYAARMGYDFRLAVLPVLHRLGPELVWFKIHLIRAALQRGYDWVLFVDADARIQSECPPVEPSLHKDKSIYLTRGYSGRFNSGVMLFRRTNASFEFLITLLRHRTDVVPAEDDVGWGENGHVIHFAKANPSVQALDERWNNNGRPLAADYIRHFSAGPMRACHKAGVIPMVKAQLTAIINRLLVRLAPQTDPFAQALLFERWAQACFQSPSQNANDRVPVYQIEKKERLIAQKHAEILAR